MPSRFHEFWNVRWYWQYNGSGSVQYNQSDNANTTYHIECQRAADYIEGKSVNIRKKYKDSEKLDRYHINRYLSN